MQATGHPASAPEGHREGSLKKLCHCDHSRWNLGWRLIEFLQVLGPLAASPIFLGIGLPPLASWNSSIRMSLWAEASGAVKTGAAAHRILCGAWWAPQQAMIAQAMQEGNRRF